MKLDQNELADLESCIDKHSLADVVIALAVIAEEKATHIEDNWQDRELAKSWQRDSDKLSKVFNKLVH
jgi:hypothetical protein